MIMVAREELRQRADYTQKFNTSTGRHGWLRLTPAYSLKVVEDLISQYNDPQRILDPFCGTATTALSAAYHGHEGVTTDINPFLVWFGQAKTRRYEDPDIRAAVAASVQALGLVASGGFETVPAPGISNSERWWDAQSLLFLRQLRSAIDTTTQSGSPQQTLLLVAFCRCLIALSNAAFNHQSMSFRDGKPTPMGLDRDFAAQFTADVRFVLSGAAHNPSGSSTVVRGDARDLSQLLDGTFDLVITSPPYANRMSYIRELRPYMYWLGFLTNGRDAGELDWEAIGGTWGIATSRLAEWQPHSHFRSETLSAALEGIADHANKNGRLLATYVAKYFDDMWEHFNGIRTLLNRNAEIHYIVGNSTFYGVLLPVERMYAEMLGSLGFDDVRCTPLRKRNSKKELIEFDVSARWRG